jgi:osmoprotectant transport system ATP-binding protein
MTASSTLPTPVGKPAISFEAVGKSYGDNRRPALADLSLDVREREFLAVVGASGSGKTTLLGLINRLGEPTSGQVRLNGTDVRSLDGVVLRRSIGYVFQGIGLFPHMTVAENIAITPRLIGMPKPTIAVRVDELLDLVRLDRAQHRNRFPHELSGGERQRVGFARALAARPRIMLLDEPFGALDPVTRDGLGGDYRRLHETLGLTTVMITHDMLEALLLADRIAVLSAGRLIALDTPAALMAGAAGPEVEALMQTPRRQAERLRALTARATP